MKMENPITVTNSSSNNKYNASEKTTKQKNSITANQSGGVQVTSSNNQSILQKRSHRIQSANSKKQEQFNMMMASDSKNSNGIDASKHSNKPVCRSMPMKIVRKYNMKNPRLRPRNIVTEPSSSQATAIQTNISSTTGVTTQATSAALENMQFSNAESSPGLKSIKIQKRESKEALPPRTINEAQEEQIIKLLEIQQRKRLELDPMRELDEALMDRTTASMNRRQKLTTFHTATSELREEEFTPDIVDINCQTISRMPLKSESSPEPSQQDESRSMTISDKASENNLQSSNQLKKSSKNTKTNIIQKNDNLQSQNVSDINQKLNTLITNKSQSVSQRIQKITQNREAQQAQSGTRHRAKGLNSDSNGVEITDNTHNHPIQEDQSEEDIKQRQTEGHNCQLINKRNLKSYQKKMQKQKSNDHQGQAAHLSYGQMQKQRSHQVTDCTDIAQGNQYEQNQFNTSPDKMINNQQFNEESKIISSWQDSINLQSHIQLNNQDTPQQFHQIQNQNIIDPDQNLLSESDINHLLFKDKDQWVMERSKSYLSSMSRHIKLIPNFCNIKPPSSPATEENSKGAKNRNSKCSKNSKVSKKDTRVQKLNTAQNSKMISFRNMTLRMLNLTNMIHIAQLRHLSLLRKTFSASVPTCSPQKDLDDVNERLVASDEECIEPILAKRQKLTSGQPRIRHKNRNEAEKYMQDTFAEVKTAKPNQDLETQTRRRTTSSTVQAGADQTISNSKLPEKPTKNKDDAKQVHHRIQGNTLKTGYVASKNEADIQMNEENQTTRLLEEALAVPK